MRGTKRIVFAFIPSRESGYATLHTQLTHTFAPAGQNFVRIGLVPYIPYQLVMRRIKNIMQGDG